MPIAAGKTCLVCSTLVTCSGNEGDAALYGKCPCCGAVAVYVLDQPAYNAELAAAEEAQREANIAANAAAAAAAVAAEASEAPSAGV